jgi:hypothetical protein
MKTETTIGRVDIHALNTETRRQVTLSMASDQTIAAVLGLARPRLQMTGSLVGRREGDLIPLENNLTVGDVLSSGDCLVVEPARSGRCGQGDRPRDLPSDLHIDRVGSGLAAGPAREADVDDDAFRAAAAKIASDSLSPDSAKFLGHARQPQGE